MKFIKKNKFTIIAILIFICIVIVGAKIKDFLVPDSGKAVYGDRLDGIDDYKLSDSLIESIKSSLSENENVLDVSYELHGKIINFMITVSDSLSISDAKKIANSTVSYFENEELTFYSLQVYVLKNDESLNNFPIIGYKDTDSSELVFTKDRKITVSEDESNEK